MAHFQIVESPTRGFQPYGAGRAFWGFKGREGILSGPAETGKTLTALHKLDACAWKYKGMRGAILRQTYASMPGTVLETYIKKVLGAWNPELNDGRGGMDNDLSPVKAYGGEKPQWFDYPTGSRIYIGGMDNPQKALSGERDVIYVNQAEELALEAWEVLISRSTGRAGNMPYAQLIGDCNPDAPTHWIKERQLAGKLTLFESRHEDNPTLWDAARGEWTEQGKISLAALDSMTGVRYLRLRKGIWAAAEGVIYDVWEDGPIDGNVTEEADYIPDGGEVLWAIDDGYVGEYDTSTGGFTANSHPRVFLLCQLRENGVLCIFEESYKIKTLSDEHIAHVLAMPYPRPEYATVDKSAAELKARLHAQDIYTRNGPASVEESIKEAMRRVGKDVNGRRTVLVHPRCKHLRREMPAYRRDPDTGKPIKAFDHGPDALRYKCWSLRLQ